MSNLITVKGIGKVRIKPDMVILNIKLESKDFNYRRILEKISELTRRLEVAIKKYGFDSSDLKLVFNINSDYESRPNDKGVYESVFVGYICNQWVSLEIDLDMELIGGVLESISDMNINPNISFSFSVRNKNKVNEEVLISATEDARLKANILARASSCNLGEIVDISYNFQDLENLSATKYEVNARQFVSSNSVNLEINPEDISIEETVSFSWKLINK